VINKNVTEEDILRATQDAFSAGWSSVKLYFMLGLPTETDEDILVIAALSRKVSQQFYSLPKEQRGKGLRLTVSVSTFVPKPFTAFQWCGQVPAEEIRRRQELLKNAIRGIRGAELHCHFSELSVLEAAFSRGDEKLAGVLKRAYELGCRFAPGRNISSPGRGRRRFPTADSALRTMPEARMTWKNLCPGICGYAGNKGLSQKGIPPFSAGRNHAGLPRALPRVLRAANGRGLPLAEESK
jgi:hypothetical protein